MVSIENALHDFEPISLTQMDAVSLMDRLDRKYLFHEKLLPEFLASLSQHYKVLEIEGKRLMGYRSLYYDTQSMQLYYKHHAGYSSRYKVRFREYLDTGDVFFEIKHRNNKGRTQKRRIPQQQLMLSLADDTSRFLDEKTRGIDDGLHPSLWVSFKRITLVNTIEPERVTIDVGLHVHHNHLEQTFHGLVIAESKLDRDTASEFDRLMKEHHIIRGSVSKYCIGIASLMPEIRSNRFKTKLQKINKIINEHPVTSH